MHVHSTATRFIGLDLVRGVAAVAVVLFHYSQLRGTPWLNRGWLAVDIFFCLSGFVIAHGYQKKLEQGMTLAQFFKKRFSRLYPLYFFGLFLGCCTALLNRDILNGFSTADLGKMASLGILVLPYFNDVLVHDGGSTVKGSLFPINDPSWSMFFELFVNFVFCILIFIGIRRFSFICVLGAACFVWAASRYGLNSGWNTESFWAGFPRVTYSFFAGVVIYRLRNYASEMRTQLGLLATLVMLVCFCLPQSKFISLLCVAAVGPMVVLANAPVVLGPRMATVASFFGGISYPIYITHIPVYRAVSLLEPTGGWAMPAWTVIVMATGIAVLVGYLAFRLDEMFRQSLALRSSGKLTVV